MIQPTPARGQDAVDEKSKPLTVEQVATLLSFSPGPKRFDPVAIAQGAVVTESFWDPDQGTLVLKVTLRNRQLAEWLLRTKAAKLVAQLAKQGLTCGASRSVLVDHKTATLPPNRELTYLVATLELHNVGPASRPA